MEPRLNRAPKLLIGLYEPGAPLTNALNRCRVLGVPDSALDVLTTIPLSYPLAQQPSALPLHRWAFIGGLLGLLTGIALTAGTALLYPIKTGGMPIVAPPVVGLIAYEGMMLGAILLTFVVMLRRIHQTAHLPQHEKIDDGLIGLSIEVGDGAPPIDALRRALEDTGACEIIQR
jgi:hypothetical protein